MAVSIAIAVKYNEKPFLVIKWQTKVTNVSYAAENSTIYV